MTKNSNLLKLVTKALEIVDSLIHSDQNPDDMARLKYLKSSLLRGDHVDIASLRNFIVTHSSRLNNFSSFEFIPVEIKNAQISSNKRSKYPFRELYQVVPKGF